MLSISLSIFEIIALFVSAIVIGVVVNLFFSSRRGTKTDIQEGKKSLRSGVEEWKLKYLNEAVAKDREITDLMNCLSDATENKRIYEIEIEEQKSKLRKVNV